MTTHDDERCDAAGCGRRHGITSTGPEQDAVERVVVDEIARIIDMEIMKEQQLGGADPNGAARSILHMIGDALRTDEAERAALHAIYDNEGTWVLMGSVDCGMEAALNTIAAMPSAPPVAVTQADDDLSRRVEALEKQANHLEAHLRAHEKNVHEGIREYLADLNSGQRHIREGIEQLRKWAYRRFEELTPDKPEPHLPTPEDRDPRIDGPIGVAYAHYDGDDRASGPDDFSAFADALEIHARVLLREELERFFSYSLGEDPS